MVIVTKFRSSIRTHIMINHAHTKNIIVRSSWTPECHRRTKQGLNEVLVALLEDRYLCLLLDLHVLSLAKGKSHRGIYYLARGRSS